MVKIRGTWSETERGCEVRDEAGKETPKLALKKAQSKRASVGDVLSHLD